MSQIMPKSELCRRALKFMKERLENDPSISRQRLLDEAGMRFNLSPRDAAELDYILKKILIR